MAQKVGWMWASIGLLCISLLSVTLGAYYYTEYTRFVGLYNKAQDELRKYDRYIFVDMLVDYGNGTKDWSNRTLIVRGADLLNATRIVSEVEYTRGVYGAFVTRINGVGGDPNTYWLWYVWNSTSSSWDVGMVASDAYILNDGDVVAWIYTRF